MNYLLIAIFVVGAVICCLNPYYSHIRYTIHRISGKNADTFQGASGVPMAGSLLVVIGLLGTWRNPLFLWSGIIFLLIDTCGPLWMAGTLIYMEFWRKRKNN